MIRKFAKLRDSRVAELFLIDEEHERFAEITAEAVDVTDQDVQLDDEHDGTSFKEREPEMFHAIRAMAMALKALNAGLPIPQKAIDIFKKIKDAT